VKYYDCDLRLVIGICMFLAHYWSGRPGIIENSIDIVI